MQRTLKPDEPFFPFFSRKEVKFGPLVDILFIIPLMSNRGVQAA
jgi:hypothetical protein